MITMVPDPSISPSLLCHFTVMQEVRLVHQAQEVIRREGMPAIYSMMSSNSILTCLQDNTLHGHKNE